MRVDRWLLVVLAGFAVCGAGDGPSPPLPPRPPPIVTDPPRVTVSHAIWEQQPVAGPSADTELYFDRGRGTVRGLSQSLGKVFEWDGAAWGVVGALAPLPLSSCSFAVFDPDKDVVYYACHDVQPSTYLVVSSGAAWVRATLPPSAPLTFSLTYDEARKELVLFGSPDAMPGETWTGKGDVWTLRAPSGTVPATGGRPMVFDTHRGVTVMFGEDDCSTLGAGCGAKYTSEVWEWNGALWKHASPSAKPPGRLFGSIAYDSARGRTVLFGGVPDSVPPGDTWEWDGATWYEAHPAAHPPDGFTSGLVFDRTRARTVFLGSANLGRTDTWLYWSYGDACTTADACDTARCDEGVCCTVACGPCERCDDKGSGCTVLRGRDDPGTCDGRQTCDLDGACRAKGGQACTHAADCASRECTNAICCATRCAPFACAGDGACKVQCAAAVDCAPGAVCRAGVCFVPPDKCTSEHVSTSSTNKRRIAERVVTRAR